MIGFGLIIVVIGRLSWLCTINSSQLGAEITDLSGRSVENYVLAEQ